MIFYADEHSSTDFTPIQENEPPVFAKITKVYGRDELSSVPAFVKFSHAEVEDPSTIKTWFSKTAKGSSLSAEGEHLGYTSVKASTYEKDYLGIRNKETGEMILYPADNYKMIPVLKPPDEMKTDDIDKEKEIIRKEKIRLFGSKKRQRLAATFEKFQIKTADMKEEMETMAPLDYPIDEQPLKELLPSHNFEGTTLEEVYPLKGILRDEVMDALNAPASALIEAMKSGSEWKTTFPKFVQTLLLTCGEDKVALICYFTYLVEILKLSVRDLAVRYPFSKTGLCNAPWKPPQSVEDAIFSAFTETLPRWKRLRSQKNKDSMMAHALVTGLYINSAVELEELITYTKYTKKKLITLCRAMRLSLNRTAEKATLQFPLPVPKIMGKRKRK